MNDTLPITTVENPATLREVGIHLGHFANALRDIKDIERQHHADNVARGDLLFKKLDDMQIGFPSRTEFNLLKQEVDGKASKWVEKSMIAVASTVGVAIIIAILKLIILQ